MVNLDMNQKSAAMCIVLEDLDTWDTLNGNCKQILNIGTHPRE